MANYYLVFTEYEWNLERETKALGFSFTEEELKKGIKNKGFIGTKNSVNCYISVPLNAYSTR